MESKNCGRVTEEDKTKTEGKHVCLSVFKYV